MNQEVQSQDIVFALAASPNFRQDGVCFAARASGLYRSDDAGKSWHFAYDSLDLKDSLPTMAITISPDFASDGTVFAGVPGGFLRSFDGGQTWHIAQLPAPPPTVSDLVISPDYTRDGILLAGTVEDGVFSSADRGGRWVAWNFGLLDLNIICLAISPAYAEDETLFAGTDSGIFYSTNGGRAWREAAFSLDLAPVLSLALSPNYASDGILFAGTESHGLYRSDDRGQTWIHLGEDAIPDAVNSILLSPEFPARADLLVVLSERLLVSRDGGQSWVDWAPGLDPRQGLACVAAPQGLEPGAPLLVGLVDGGVMRI